MSSQDIKQYAENFRDELQSAAANKPSCFPFIVHQIPSKPLVKDTEVFQVISIGGSNLLNALLKRSGKNIHMVKRESKPLHVFLTAEEFFGRIDKELDPTITHLAINFAFPLKPVFERGRLDGILTSGTKEHVFEGLQGQKVGGAIEKHVKEKYNRDIVVSIANDTICLLLSGLTEVAERDIAAGILGTGLNFALFLDDNHPVNLEAANFDKFEQTDTGILIDKASNKPGSALLEKEVSGAYLYKHFNEVLKRDSIPYPPLSATKELDALLEDPTSDVYPIAKALLERAASFIACAIAGITMYKQKDMTFVMEGSLFWSARYFRQNVKRTLLSIIPDYAVTFVKIEDSPIFGAAKLIA